MKLQDNLTSREWSNILANEYGEKYFKELNKFINDRKKKLCPRPENIFKSLNLTSYNNTKVVIIGQSPYHQVGLANGLSFSNDSVPASLKNMFKELESDLGIKNTSGDLTSWSNQGILLLNRVLTTEVNKVDGHTDKGWEQLTDKIITALDNRVKPIVFILLGKKSQELQALINSKHHLVICAPHPSPFSARSGFFGSKIYSKTNQFLINNNMKPINWSTTIKEKMSNELFV